MIAAGKLLRNAAVRIADPKNHIQGFLAKTDRDADGSRQPTLPTDPNATCWCLMGAVAAEAGAVAKTPRDMFGRSVRNYEFWVDMFSSKPEGEFAKALDLLDEAALQIYGRADDDYSHDGIFDMPLALNINDRLGHEAALKVLQRAIEIDDARTAAE